MGEASNPGPGDEQRSDGESLAQDVLEVAPTQGDNDDEWSPPRASRVSQSVEGCLTSQGESRWEAGSQSSPRRPIGFTVVTMFHSPVPPSKDLLDGPEADLLAPQVFPRLWQTAEIHTGFGQIVIRFFSSITTFASLHDVDLQLEFQSRVVLCGHHLFSCGWLTD